MFLVLLFLLSSCQIHKLRTSLTLAYVICCVKAEFTSFELGYVKSLWMQNAVKYSVKQGESKHSNYYCTIMHYGKNTHAEL